MRSEVTWKARETRRVDTATATHQGGRLSHPAGGIPQFAVGRRLYRVVYQRGWRGSRRGSRGRASLTVSARPARDMPLRASMALCAAWLSGISTKQKPRERPVSRSVIILTVSIVPYGSKSWRRSCSVVLKARLPTKMFMDGSPEYSAHWCSGVPPSLHIGRQRHHAAVTESLRGYRARKRARAQEPCILGRRLTTTETCLAMQAVERLCTVGYGMTSRS